MIKQMNGNAGIFEIGNQIQKSESLKDCLKQNFKINKQTISD